MLRGGKIGTPGHMRDSGAQKGLFCYYEKRKRESSEPL
jgi:hypothetical protein